MVLDLYPPVLLIQVIFSNQQTDAVLSVLCIHLVLPAALILRLYAASNDDMSS